MHRILKSHLDNFVKSFELGANDESEQFEHFANYCVVSPKTGENFDIADITTGNGDSGIDGVAVIINEELVVSASDAALLFHSDKKNHDVEIVFVQAKTSENYDLGDFLKFQQAVLAFVKSESYKSNDECETNAHEIYETCLINVPKIRGGKPQITVRYIGTGIYQKPEAIEKAKGALIASLTDTGYFSSVDVEILGRDELTDLWVSTYSAIQAQLPIFSNAPLPTIQGIEEAYLVVARARDVVEKLLTSEDGNLRGQVFEENVRSFLGSDNAVNRSIAETLNDHSTATRFPVMNNGITIVSEDVRVQGNVIHLENYQIVNGCQTSHVLFENRSSLSDDVMVNLKIIETANEDVFAELVRATNSQSKIEDTQFFSLRPIVKRTEQYFATFHEDEDARLYLERRDRQYIGKEVPAVRIFSVNNAAKCVAAMFFNRPDLSYRYPKQMYEDLGESIFDEKNREVIFYTACLALYRAHLLISNGAIPQNMKKTKWHMLSLLRVAIAGKEMPSVNSKKIEKYCALIIDALSKHQSSIEPFQQVTGAIEKLGALTGDRLKRQAVLEDMLQALEG